MKKILPSALACCVLAVAPAAWASKKACFENMKVAAVSGGYNEGHLGPDGGDAVYFSLENGGTYALNYQFNLDWNRGQALHRTLMTAFVGGYRISGWDHWGGNCDDIDQITIIK